MKEMIYQIKMNHERLILDEGQAYGYDCKIISLGTYPCAYIKIPKYHQFYGRQCADVRVGDEWCPAHGGLTFAGDGKGCLDKYGLNWWLGWDYAHAGDYIGCLGAIRFGTLAEKKWTTEEIRQDVLRVAEWLKDNEWGGSNSTI